MRFFNIAIYRKIPAENIYPGNTKGLPPTLNIELGKWWEIVITRELAEHMYRDNYPIIPAVKFSPQVYKDKTFIYLIKDGEIIPFWYGYAYYDFARDCAAYCPVPINFLVAGARWLGRKWWEFKGLSRKFNSTQDAYARGRVDGRKAGYEDGYNQGRKGFLSK